MFYTLLRARSYRLQSVLIVSPLLSVRFRRSTVTTAFSFSFPFICTRFESLVSVYLYSIRVPTCAPHTAHPLLLSSVARRSLFVQYVLHTQVVWIAGRRFAHLRSTSTTPTTSAAKPQCFRKYGFSGRGDVMRAA